MRNLALAVVLLAGVPAHAEVLDAKGVQGVWKLLSYRASYDSGPSEDIFGAHPKGYLALLPEGRLFSIITAEGRKPGLGETEQVALFKTLTAYTGRYRVEGDKLVTAVDASWVESWNGADQARTVTLQGDRMTMVMPPSKSVLRPGRTVVTTLEWEREKP